VAHNPDAISTLKVAEATQQSVEASAAVQQAEASMRQAIFAVEVAKGNVTAIEAALATRASIWRNAR
jgi:hypothetical protein